MVQVPLLLSRGFAVLLPNPRGSQGRGEAFVRGIVGEVGGLDVDDILSGVDRAVAEGITSPTTVGVMGTSYGGFLAAWLATWPGRFAAALASSPVTDWVSQHYTTNIPQSDVRFLRGHPLDPASDYRGRSPLTAASDRTCPVLLTAGRHDLATPPAQALELHRALVELGVDSDIALDPREGHDVHEWPALLDHCTRMLLWFERHLRLAGGGEPPGPGTSPPLGPDHGDEVDVETAGARDDPADRVGARPPRPPRRRPDSILGEGCRWTS